MNAWLCCDVNYKAWSCSAEHELKETGGCEKIWEDLLPYLLVHFVFGANATNIWQNLSDYENNVQLRNEWYYLGNIEYRGLQEYEGSCTLL